MHGEVINNERIQKSEAALLAFPGSFHAGSGRPDTSLPDRRQQENQIRTRQSSQLYTPVTLTQLLFQFSVSAVYFALSPPPFLLPDLEGSWFCYGKLHRDPTPETHQTSRNPRGTGPQRIARGIKQLVRDIRYVTLCTLGRLRADIERG
ncbi:hypothetical protein KM043_007047 [Ampulex compressa]|nr:hypothetical protein KM043_007047 [Ampulex compressa]